MAIIFCKVAGYGYNSILKNFGFDCRKLYVNHTKIALNLPEGLFAI